MQLAQPPLSVPPNPTPAVQLCVHLLYHTSDVDGTLIHSIGKEANKLHKECFTAGFKEVFGLDTNIDVVEHHGSTDPLIVLKVLEHHGIPKEQVGCQLHTQQACMLCRAGAGGDCSTEWR
mgnify:CR=1 FL=1